MVGKGYHRTPYTGIFLYININLLYIYKSSTAIPSTSSNNLILNISSLESY
jgi:hypothetical protein